LISNLATSGRTPSSAEIAALPQSSAKDRKTRRKLALKRDVFCKICAQKNKRYGLLEPALWDKKTLLTLCEKQDSAAHFT
jgi:hypothetical protein